MTKTQENLIVSEIVKTFPTFGGDRSSEWNPITTWVEDKPTMFAMGVDVRAVVRRVVLALNKKPKRRKSGSQG